MARIERTTEIAVNPDAVWDVIADLSGVAAWNPNVASATCGSGPMGVGATRTCHMVRGGRIDEVVSGWDEGHDVQFAIGSHGGIRSADMGMTLTETAHGTQVTATVDYHLAFGPLGPVIDRLAVKRQMAQMLEDGLCGLEGYLTDNQAEQPTRREVS